MSGLRSAAIGAVGLLLIGAALGGSSAASAGTVVAARTQAAGAPVRGELAVRGPNNHVFVAQNDEPGQFVDLGGRLLSTPAIAFSQRTRSDYVIGVGTDHVLWIFDHGSGAWHHLLSAGAASCRYAPAVAVSGSTLGVACTDASSAHLLAATATLPVDGSAPRIRGLQDQGGRSLAGPSLFFAGGTLHAWVLSETSSQGNLYSRSVTDPYGRYAHVDAYCATKPTVTAPLGRNGFYLGCQSGNAALYGGSGHSMRWDTTGARGVSGTMSGVVGIARAADRSSASYFVTDLHGAIWRTNISPTGQPTWTRFGGHAKPGVSATSTPASQA